MYCVRGNSMKAARKKHGWVYHGALAVVILMMIAIGALWIASFNRWVVVKIPLTQNSHLEIWTVPGNLQIYYNSNSRSDHDLSATAYTYAEINRNLSGAVLRPPEANWLRVRWLESGANDIWGFEFPLWMPLAALSIWPIITLIRWRIRKRPAGLCTVCSYDLRGTPSGVCPECGKDAKTSGTPAKTK